MNRQRTYLPTYQPTSCCTTTKFAIRQLQCMLSCVHHQCSRSRGARTMTTRTTDNATPVCVRILTNALLSAYVWLAGWLAGWMDGWMDGWIDGWVGGWCGYLRDVDTLAHHGQRVSKTVRGPRVGGHCLLAPRRLCRVASGRNTHTHTTHTHTHTHTDTHTHTYTHKAQSTKHNKTHTRMYSH